MAQPMWLYSLTLQRASAITAAVYGNFSAPKAQEIVAARGKVLELLRPDESGRVLTVCSVEVFGLVRSLLPFRLTGGNRDYVVVGSDSGCIAVLQYNPERNVFDRVHLETFGKSGCRRIVPGQYLAADPRGRAVMVGAVEKQKLVYVLNRDSAARLTISSPLEAHKSHTLCWHLAGVDVGFENPVFAALELDYGAVDADTTGEAARSATKHLTYYELDLGLNHVVRKASEPIDAGANLLVTVPGATDGPGGMLICCENAVVYRAAPGAPELRVALPRRIGQPPDQGLLVVAYATHKQKDMFFFLLQSELGDLYKVKLSCRDDKVHRLHVRYFDTVPVAAALCVFRTGFLYVAAELGNHLLYRFQGIGEDEADAAEVVAEVPGAPAAPPVHFAPRPLRNLLPIDEGESLAPLLDLHVADLLREDSPQLYALCGRGPRSSFRVLRYGLPAAETVAGQLPGTPAGVFSLRRAPGDATDAFVLFSFVNATLAVAVGDSLEEVKEPEKVLGIAAAAPTLYAGMLADGSWLQVHPFGIRHIHHSESTAADGSSAAAAATTLRVAEWKAPAKRIITHASGNSRQLVIVLGGGELYSFELDGAGQLAEVERRELGRDVAAIDVAPLPEGRARARFVAVAEQSPGGADAAVRILSLDPEDQLKSLAMQALPTAAESLAVLALRTGGGGGGGDGGGGAASSSSSSSSSSLVLHVGLVSGVLLRTSVDSVTGELTDPRTRFLGPRRVRLVKTVVQGLPAMLALGARPWLVYSHQGRVHTAPLSYPPLDYAAAFASPSCPEGVVAVAGAQLRIFATERLGDTFHQVSHPLRYTPRAFVLHPPSGKFVVVEADHRALSLRALHDVEMHARKERQSAAADSAMAVEAGDGGGAAAEAEAEAPISEQELERRSRELGVVKGAPGTWGSCIRLLDPGTGATLDLLELEDDEAAVSVCACSFPERGAELLIAVGTVRRLQLQPRRLDGGGFIHIYTIESAPPPPAGTDAAAAAAAGARLRLVHRTAVEEAPLALCAFQGRLLAGVGRMLRIYDLGKKKLLRKCEHKNFPMQIRTLHAHGDRVVVGDVAESFHFVVYQRAENRLVIFADDYQPRWIVAAVPVDADTIAGADKFGNVCVLRLAEEVSREVDLDPTGNRWRWDQTLLNGAPNKLIQLASVHVGETVTRLVRTALAPGAAEVLLYTTVLGGVGALLPFTSREDVDFFSHLEMHLRQSNPPLLGRDHLTFRSSYVPVKNVIDGDLCEQYAAIDVAKQRQIASELDRTPVEVAKKLEDIRNKFL